MSETVCDTSPLQYLFQIGLLEVLPALYGHIVVPLAVVEEIDVGRRVGIRLPDVRLLPWARLEAVDAGPGDFPRLLGPGERDVLAFALRTPGSRVILDDAAARQYASQAGLKVVGTIGILLLAKARGLVDSIAPFIEMLDSLGFRLHAETRASALKLAGE